MTSIVELREMSTDKLEEALENAREEMYNLRFQRATGRLENYSQLKKTRQEIARLATVLNARQEAIATAAQEAEIAAALAGKEWQAEARFDYELSVWLVNFTDKEEDALASAHVNLNKKQYVPRQDRPQAKPMRLVTKYEIAG